jgi:hypothetical protein
MRLLWVSFIVSGRLLVQRSRNDCGVTKCNLEASKMMTCRFVRGSRGLEIKLHSARSNCCVPRKCVRSSKL